MGGKKKIVEWKGDSRVQTDGKNWEISVWSNPWIGDTLKNHIEEMKKILSEHPDAEVSMDEDRDYGSEKEHFTVKWWVPVPSDHAEVVRYIKKQEESERLKKEYEERNIAALRKTRPELFKDQ